MNFKSSQVEQAKEQIERQKMPKAGRGKKWFIIDNETEYAQEFWGNLESTGKINHEEN